MPMIYPQRDLKRTKKRKRIIWGSFFVFFILIIVLNFTAPHFLSPLIDVAAVPFFNTKIAASQNSSNIWQIFHSKTSLIEKNNDLENQLKNLSAIEAERNALSVENTTLRSLLGRATTTNSGVLAHVLAKPNFSPYDTLILDAGTSNGVAIGDIVLVDQAVIIGHVESVSAHTSNIALYSTPGEKNNVFLGEKSLEATAIGLGGSNFDIRLPKNAGIVVGDRVVLSQYPEYVFGTIARVDDTPVDSFDRILFTSPINTNEISFVTIHHSLHETSNSH